MYDFVNDKVKLLIYAEKNKYEIYSALIRHYQFDFYNSTNMKNKKKMVFGEKISKYKIKNTNKFLYNQVIKIK